MVAGIARTGTSTVARIIHENGIACMGHRFPAADQFNQHGYYEDLDVIQLIVRKRSGDLPGDIVEQVRAIHEKNNCVAKTLGFKHPSTVCRLTKKQIAEFKPSLIVKTYRPLDVTVDSMMRKAIANGLIRKTVWEMHGRDYYEGIYIQMKKLLDDFPSQVTIEFDRPRTDEEVLSEIENAPRRRMMD